MFPMRGGGDLTRERPLYANTTVSIVDSSSVVAVLTRMLRAERAQKQSLQSVEMSSKAVSVCLVSCWPCDAAHLFLLWFS